MEIRNLHILFSGLDECEENCKMTKTNHYTTAFHTLPVRNHLDVYDCEPWKFIECHQFIKQILKHYLALR